MSRPLPPDHNARYGAAHRRLRGMWKHRIKQGGVTCWRCGEQLPADIPDNAWDLGHDDKDRSKYRGPEHSAGCNRSAAGKASALKRRGHLRPTPRHPGVLP